MSRKYLADKIPVEENFFMQCYVDVTQKCNMNCKTCYSPNREGDDINLEYFEEVLKRMPKPVAWRLLGGEPTISDRMIPLLNLMDKYGHFAIIVTNGLLMSDLDFCKRVKDNINPEFMVSISFDGADNDEIYKKISGRPCAEFKMKALKNLVNIGFSRISLTQTVVRGFNELEVKRLYDITREHHCRYLHYRSQIPVGRWINKEDKPYTWQEIKSIIREFEPKIDIPYKEIDDNYKSPPQYKCCGECNRFWLDKELQISIIGMASMRNINCVMRGFLNDDFTFTPLFRNIRSKNGEYEIR